MVFDQLLSYLEEKWPALLGFVIVLAVGLLLVKLLMSLTKKAISRSRLDPTCHKFVLSLTKITLYLLVGIIAVSQLGVDTSSIVTVLGVGGLAVSLAVKDSLANVAGGFIVLFTKPFKVGDFVELDGVSGTVTQINILQTKLLTFDNKAVFIPNGQISDAKITNYSAEEKRLLVQTYSISYDESFERVKAMLDGLLEREELVLAEPAPVVRVAEYAASSVNIALRIWVKTEDYWNLHYKLMEDVKTLFDKNGVSIPYNQLDVHIQGQSGQAG